MWGPAIGVARRSAIPGALAASLLAGTSAGTFGQDLFEVDPGNEARGWYLGVAGGGNFVEDLDLRINDTLTGGLDVNEGWAVLGSAGYGFESGFRVELETGYRSNDIGELDNADGTTSATRGSLDTVTIMGNVLLDLRNPTRFTPYIGIGVGAANTAMELFDAGGTLLVDDDSWNFAFQGIVGVALAITNNLSLTLDYRYTQATDLSWTGVDGVTAYEADETRNHAVMAGLRYTFAPPPAAPPPVAPAAAIEPVVLAETSFMVFFNWDSALLSAQANNTLDDVVVVFNQNGVAQVFVEGHADRSGPADYNIGLSQRRAEAVRVGLIARGIAPDEIVVRAFGESRPLVATPDGVREAQNRRVEIILS